MKKDILGVMVDDVSLSEALALVKEGIDSGRKSYIVTPNPEIIMLAQKDERFRKILNEAFLSLADGFGVTAAGRILGSSIQERIPGADFVLNLAALAEEHGYSLFLLGGQEKVSERASKRLQELYPSLKVVGAISGGVLEENRQKILEEVQKQSIDILVVAFGPGKQEKWIAENLPNLDTKMAIGVGGSLDFLAGEKPRAPVFMRKVGMEWAFRLMNEPSRFRRQKQFAFAFQVLKKRFFS